MHPEKWETKDIYKETQILTVLKKVTLRDNKGKNNRFYNEK